jgi:hypothetical protein
MKSRINTLIAALSLTALSLLAARPAAAQSDLDNTTHVAWNWLKSISGTALETYLVQTDSRIVDLEVVTPASNPIFDAVVVRNTGAYAKSWRWYAGVTPAQVLSLASSAKLRPVVIAPYHLNGTLLLAVAMISNTGKDQAAWLLGATSDNSVINWLEVQQQRPIQVKPDGAGGYVAIGVANDSRKFFAYTKTSFKEITSYLNFGYRATEIVPDGPGTYTVIADNKSVGWGYFGDVSSDTAWGSATFSDMRPLCFARDGSSFVGTELQN